MTTLTAASSQWASRPADERFSSLEELHESALHSKERTRAVNDVKYNAIRAVNQGEDIILSSRNFNASLTHWSFNQLAQDIDFPPNPLRGLPASLAIQVINHRLGRMGNDASASVLVHANGGNAVRAITSNRYTRIWDADVTSRLISLTQHRPEWQPAPAAFDGSRGLYRGDRSLFAFLVDNERRIFEKDKNGGLGRGFFVWNSEVGACTFGVMTFYYEYVCGNHRVWGASGVKTIKLRHIGAADQRAFGHLEAELQTYADSSASEDEAKVVSARRMLLGANKEQVLDRIFGLKMPVLGQKLVTAAYELAEKRVDWYGNPNSVWGFTGGLTEIARDQEHADRRMELDKAAGRIMAMAF